MLAFGRAFNSLSRELTLTNAVSFGKVFVLYCLMFRYCLFCTVLNLIDFFSDTRYTGYWHLIFLTINDLALVSLESLIRKDTAGSKRASLSRKYFQPESTTSCAQEKEFILQLL